VALAGAGRVKISFKKRPIYDYHDIIERIDSGLAELGEGIAKRRLIADADDVVREISHARLLLLAWGNHEPGDEQIDQRLHGAGQNRDAAWDEFWNYLRDNMRKWWD
jgi:hypothetical protein